MYFNENSRTQSNRLLVHYVALLQYNFTVTRLVFAAVWIGMFTGSISTCFCSRTTSHRSHRMYRRGGRRLRRRAKISINGIIIEYCALYACTKSMFFFSADK